MPIDRAATLKNAEKLLRQGKLEQAIAEYRRVVDEHPSDWNTANILGDLYLRAKQVEKAVDQYTRIADHLKDEGFLPKAGAVYKKILKIKPDHEHALLQSAEMASGQGLLADARGYLRSLTELCRRRNDSHGMAQIAIRLGSLDPSDYDARAGAARARVEAGDVPGAIRDYKEMADELSEQARQPEALEALRQAAILSPEDRDVRRRLLDIYLAAGDFALASECATSAAQLKEVAARLTESGRQHEATEMLREAARLDPGDTELRAGLARVFVERGDLAGAAEYFTEESAASDPRLTMAVAEMRLRSGEIDEGLGIVARLIERDPLRRQDVALLGWTIAEQTPELGFQLVQMAAEASVAQLDWPSAAAALQEFVTRVPNHLPALMRLVEICVDGGLEATLYTAQAHLADAYLAAGSAAEARFIAEDLVAREPWDRANLERFRQALIMMSEPDPDGLIADRLSGQSPFTSTDLSLNVDESTADHCIVDDEVASAEPEPGRDYQTPAADNVDTASAPPSSRLDLTDDSVDLGSILGDLESAASVRGRLESVEVDLSIVLDGIQGSDESCDADESVNPADRAEGTVQGEGADLDTVFAHMRTEASRRAELDAADQEYQRGLELFGSGRADEAIGPLQAASRAPRLRFATASLLGRIYREQGKAPQTIEWLERAAQAPAPSPGEYHALLLELAEVLESTGEVARALAICMELRADAGDYRDVADRVQRLAKVQARG